MRVRQIIILLCIIAVAALFRFTGINWDDNAHLNPDERFLTMVATSVSWPASIAQYFDTKSSPLNPHNRGYNFYVYGTYPMIFTKLVATLVHMDTYDGITIVGRTLSGILDLLTLSTVFLIAGPLAAFCYGVMVLPIQLSHFFTVDPYATLCITIVLYRILRHKFDTITGIALALAVGAKVSAALVIPIVVLAYITSKPWKNPLWFILGFLITFRIIYPYLFDGVFTLNPLILANWRQLKAFDGDQTTFPPALQWIGVYPWQPILDLLIWGLGLPLGALTVISLWKRPHRILTTWIVFLLLYQSFQFAKAMRYLWPIYPALAIIAGTYLSSLRKQFMTLSLCVVLLLYPFAFLSVYLHPNTRNVATNWIYDNIPPGSTIAWETWDDPLPLPTHTNQITQYTTIPLSIYDPDSDAKWHTIAAQLSKTGYLILSSNRVYGGVAHAIKRYPITNSYYQLLFSNQLGFEKIAEFTSRPTLFGFRFVDDHAEESFTVYDHAKVTILKNANRYDPQTLYELITTTAF